MNSDGWAALIGIGTYVALRLIDRMLPSGASSSSAGTKVGRPESKEDDGEWDADPAPCISTAGRSGLGDIHLHHRRTPMTTVNPSPSGGAMGWWTPSSTSSSPVVDLNAGRSLRHQRRVGLAATAVRGPVWSRGKVTPVDDPRGIR